MNSLLIAKEVRLSIWSFVIIADMTAFMTTQNELAYRQDSTLQDYIDKGDRSNC